MDQMHYKEMEKKLEQLIQSNILQDKKIYLFGHCNATEELADLIIKKGYEVQYILDNNKSKQGDFYRGIPVVRPEVIVDDYDSNALVCIVARAGAAMEMQLKQAGFKGKIEKLIVYNSYAEYSFSEDTVLRKQARLKRGIELLKKQKEKYSGVYRIYCPFSALGDVYYMMSYLPYFLANQGVSSYVVFTVGVSCEKVVEMFGADKTESLSQLEMDESIQAVLYTADMNAYIPHQDRPYVVNLARALYIKKIPLELLYKYGVFGLDKECVPFKPCKLKPCNLPEQAIPGKSVILSPYAKSVSNIPVDYWNRIVRYYKGKRYYMFTNVTNGEEALPGTERLEVSLDEIQSAAEQAGIFVGLRSGLCDVIKGAACRKIALYPNRYYSDTKWKMEEIYHLDEWENIVVY